MAKRLQKLPTVTRRRRAATITPPVGQSAAGGEHEHAGLASDLLHHVWCGFSAWTLALSYWEAGSLSDKGHASSICQEPRRGTRLNFQATKHSARRFPTSPVERPPHATITRTFKWDWVATDFFPTAFGALVPFSASFMSRFLCGGQQPDLTLHFVLCLAIGLTAAAALCIAFGFFRGGRAIRALGSSA